MTQPQGVSNWTVSWSVSGNAPIRQISQALLVLVISALILVIGYIVVIAVNSESAETLDLSQTAQFRAIAGSIEKVDGRFTITGFQTTTDDRQAIVTLNRSFNASSYPLVTYKLNTAPPGMNIEVIWRLASEPAQMYLAQLEPGSENPTTTSLSQHPKWDGRVTEIAFRLSGKHAAKSVAIEKLQLHSTDWRSELSALWSQWTEYRGWTMRSINALYGSADPRALSPTVAIASWAGLAALLLTLSALPKRKVPIAAYVAVLLVPWIALDMLWQNELNAQLKETRNIFAGKTTKERHLVDIDSESYRYATRLKNDVLPSTPSRIFIAHDARGHNSQRLKTQYYLLPHNIYNFGRIPPSDRLRAGDYILAQGEIPGLTFDPETNRLHMRGKKLPVLAVDKHQYGTLYQVAPNPGNPGD